MKRKILTILLAGISALTFAQQKDHLSRCIDDDGKKLSISVNGTINGENIEYSRTFDVAGLSKEERSAITQKVFVSLGLGEVSVPKQPRPARAPKPAQSVPEPAAYAHITDSKNEGMKQVFGTSLKPYKKEVEFDQTSGEMHLRYQFMRGGDEFIFEKTVDASAKSAKQREQIIKNFEAEIDLLAAIEEVAL
jgi:hypothetical protein